MKNKPQILIIDDEKKLLDNFEGILNTKGYLTYTALTGGEALELAEKYPIDLVFLDYHLPDMTGTAVLERLWEKKPLLPVIMISERATVEKAVNATRAGVLDFLEKDKLTARSILNITEKYLSDRFSQAEKAELSETYFQTYGMIGISGSMRRLYDMIDKVAPTNASVLLLGESGTGKELVASAIHRQSSRKAQPCIKINCASIPHDLIESELFGHEKGSFTHAYSQQKGKFALAHNGTILLDEIGDMDITTQSKVLRVLQNGEITPVGSEENFYVNVRVIAATNQNLKEKIKTKTFRKDLLYRLNVVTFHLPPLRERKEDIPLLANHFLQYYCERYNRPLKRFTSRAIEVLLSLDWTDNNVRELEHFIEKAVILLDDELVDLAALQKVFDLQSLETQIPPELTLREAREWFEKDFIKNRLIANNWNVAATASSMGIERTNLHRKMNQYGIQRPIKAKTP
jgi:two-component system nitrogen regulation response regulator NtrX